MEIKRDMYLKKMIRKKKNGLIKVVTGVRRCGKSYLLFHLFHKHLLEEGVPEDHIIEIALDDRRNRALRDPDAMLRYIEARMQDADTYYIILDEVQYMDEFEDVLNSLLHISNADVYVTGSNPDSSLPTSLQSFAAAETRSMSIRFVFGNMLLFIRERWRRPGMIMSYMAGFR